MRLDVYLFQNNYVKSRQKAKSLIEGGNVKFNGNVITKASYEVNTTIENSITINDDCIYVSRGGLKLEAILKSANIDVTGLICVDIGASTGGFTDCLLKNGAKKIYAIDSGTNQLDPSLKNNEKVVSIENFNARNISIEHVGNTVDIITIDVSFISQTLIIPNALKLLNENGLYLSLIKPQFEVGKANVGKGGIVKNKRAILNAIDNIISVANECGFVCTNLIKSPILGGDGNTEFLAVFSRKGSLVSQNLIKNLVLN